MFNKKNSLNRKLKKANINKEVIEHIKDTKRKMKEKIPQASKKEERKESQHKEKT